MQRSIFLGLCFLATNLLFAQNHADDILGYYLTVDPFTDAISQVEVYKASENIYEGRVTWVKEEKRKKFVGMVFMKNLIYNLKEKKWESSEIKYPGKSGTFSANVTLEPDNKLKLRGYWGLSFLGKTTYWTPEEEIRQ